MILLDGHSLTPAKKVAAVAMSLQLKERDATASLTPVSAEGIGVNSWLKDDTEPGSGIVWRVKSIQQAFNQDSVTLSLEHAINTLRDKILFGEVTPAMMAGRLGATTCTAQEAITYILNQQSDWVLDTTSFAYGSVSNPYKFDGETLFEAIQTISDSLTDPWWSYDMSVYPFKLKITAKQSGVDSVLRPGRNLRTISKTIDKSQMFTRFYPIGADDLHIDSDYVEKNVSTYGLVSKVETDNSISTKAELTRWANERLNKHAEPAVTIDIEGLELSRATGESMDGLTLGRICAVYLPEFNTTIQERITALSYPDKIGTPEMVKITLANTQTDVMKVLADSLKKGGKSSRSSAKRDKEDMAWFEDTNEHVAMVAKGIVGVDAQGNPNWIRLSQIVVSGTGIDETVQSIQNDQVIAEGRISITETKVGMTVKSNDARPTKVYATYNDLPATGGANYKYFVEASGKYYKWENNAYVEFNPNGIAAGEICVAINDSGESEARITADKVYIGNEKSSTVIAGKCELSDVTAAYIKSQIETVNLLNVQAIASASGSLAYAYLNEFKGNYYKVNVPAGPGVVNTPDLCDGVFDIQIVDNGDDTYTLQKKAIKDSSWTDVGTFNRAASSLSGDWSSGAFPLTVTDGHNNYTIGIGGSYGAHNVELEIVTDGSATKDSLVPYTIDVPIKVGSLNSGSASTERYTKDLAVSVIGLLQSKTVSASGSADVTVTPDSDKMGLSSVKVNQIKAGPATVTPTTSAQVILPASGDDYLTSVMVNGVSLESKTVSASTSGDVTVTPGTGYIGLSSVKVNQIKAGPATVTPTTSAQTVLPASGDDFLTSVMVNAAPLTSKTVSASASGDVTVTPGTGYIGLSSVKVNQIKAGPATVTPTTSAQVILPASGDDFLTSVMVNAAPLESKTVTASNSQAVTVTPGSGYIGLSSVTVNKINTQAKTVTPTTSAQVILPDSGYSYLTSVTINSAQGIWDSGHAQGLADAWINYATGQGSSHQGEVGLDSFIYPGSNSQKTWHTLKPWFGYRDTPGSNHQGTLAGGKYLRLVGLNKDGGVQMDNLFGATWYVPSGSGDSYTKYTFSKSRTQASDGYHYTFSISTGWQTPFGTSGGTYDLYKKN